MRAMDRFDVVLACQNNTNLLDLMNGSSGNLFLYPRRHVRIPQIAVDELSQNLFSQVRHAEILNRLEMLA